MRTLYNRLLFLLAVLSALPSFGYAQVHESGTDEPGPVKSQHLTAELISDSGTIDSRTRGLDIRPLARPAVMDILLPLQRQQ